MYLVERMCTSTHWRTSAHIHTHTLHFNHADTHIKFHGFSRWKRYKGRSILGTAVGLLGGADLRTGPRRLHVHVPYYIAGHGCTAICDAENNIIYCRGPTHKNFNSLFIQNVKNSKWPPRPDQVARTSVHRQRTTERRRRTEIQPDSRSHRNDSICDIQCIRALI